MTDHSGVVIQQFVVILRRGFGAEGSMFLLFPAELHRFFAAKGAAQDDKAVGLHQQWRGKELRGKKTN
jgi:hypothetical protein